MGNAHFVSTHFRGVASSGSGPSTPTLSVADDGDGSATVTVAGSSAGSTNTVYYATWDGTAGPLGSWTSGGNRTGDGTISVASGTGLFLWYVVSSLNDQSVASDPIYQVVTNGTDAILEQILVAAQSRIRSLSLTDVANASVIIQKKPANRKFAASDYPAVVIAPLGPESMIATSATNKHDDVGYPVAAIVVDNDNQDQTANRDRNLLHRERIAKAFRNQRLPGVSEVYTCQIEPGNIIDPSWFDAGVSISSMVLRFFARENRGV